MNMALLERVINNVSTSKHADQILNPDNFLWIKLSLQLYLTPRKIKNNISPAGRFVAGFRAGIMLITRCSSAFHDACVLFRQTWWYGAHFRFRKR